MLSIYETENIYSQNRYYPSTKQKIFTRKTNRISLPNENPFSIKTLRCLTIATREILSDVLNAIANFTLFTVVKVVIIGC